MMESLVCYKLVRKFFGPTVQFLTVLRSFNAEFPDCGSSAQLFSSKMISVLSFVFLFFYFSIFDSFHLQLYVPGPALWLPWRPLQQEVDHELWNHILVFGDTGQFVHTQRREFVSPTTVCLS